MKRNLSVINDRNLNHPTLLDTINAYPTNIMDEAPVDTIATLTSAKCDAIFNCMDLSEKHNLLKGLYF